VWWSSRPEGAPQRPLALVRRGDNDHMTDMPRDKDDQEDRVIRALLDHLGAVGEAAVLVEQPDRLAADQRTYPAVTSDALIRITTGGLPVDWAVDVTSLAAPSDHFVVPNALHERLDPLAAHHGVVIEIIEGISPRPNQLRNVQSAVEQLLNSGASSGAVAAEGLGITWRPAGPEETPELLLRAMLLRSPSPLLSDQVEDTVSASLTSKATRQAARARDVGCRTAVTIDRLGHKGIAQGSHWLPQHPGTIGQAVTDVLADLDHAVNAVLLLDLDDDWHVLFGAFPGVQSAD
jgi:hypothetical protein